MKIAEQVTFGGGNIDRAHELRADKSALAELAAKPDARAIALWRGKPLVAEPDRNTLVRLPIGHPVLAGLADPIFLGRTETGPLWAFDLSTWTPLDSDTTEIGTFLDPSVQLHPLLPETQVFAELRAIMARLTPVDAELAATAKAILTWHDSHGYCSSCGAKSDMSMAGWQRDCPVCKHASFPAH